jgi:hypothetical protein
MKLSVVGFLEMPPRLLEIPRTHALEAEDYLRQICPGLYPDLPDIGQLEYVVFAEHALVFRPDRQGQSGRRVPGIPAILAALIQTEEAAGHYRITEGAFAESFFFDGMQIHQHLIHDASATENGRNKTPAFDFGVPELQELCGSWLPERISSVFSGKITNSAWLKPAIGRGALQFAWFPVAALLAALFFLPGVRELRTAQQEIETLRERVAVIQAQLSQTGIRDDRAFASEVREAIAETVFSQPYRILSDFVSIAGNPYRIRSIESAGTGLRLGISGPDPLELQSRLIASGRFSEATISRIMTAPDGSRTVTLLLVPAREDGSQ